jgi:PKD repeat protein
MDSMQNRPGYHQLFTGLLLALVFTAGCRREPLEVDEPGTGSNLTVLQGNVVRLDTLVFVNQVRNGQIRFDLIGTPPAIQRGNMVYYPGASGFFGRVITTNTAGSRIFMQVEESDLSQLFSSISILDNASAQSRRLIYRTTLGHWNADTLLFDGWNLFDGPWQSKGLQVRLTSGQVFSAATPDKFWLVCQGSEPWLDRTGLNVSYSIDINVEAEIVAGGPMEASDSVLLERSEYGPFLVGGFPVTYRVDTWMGFQLAAATDTVLSVSLNGTTNGQLGLSFNYWEDWKFTRNPGYQAASVLSYAGPAYSDFTELLFVHQVVTPLFSGAQSFVVDNRLEAGVRSDVTIPNWISEETAVLTGGLTRTGPAFGAGVPPSKLTPELALFTQSHSGVLQNQRPKASFVVDPPAGFTDTNFEFDASGSSDVETSDANLLVRWDFEGDNRFDTDFTTEKTAFFKYTRMGVYDPILEVKDEGGLVARYIARVEVSTTSSAPVAYFTVTPETGRVSDIFLFNAYGCYDAEDETSLLQVRWDFDSDGVWDTGWSNEKAINHAFPAAATYVSKLEVQDTQGLIGSTTRIINVGEVNLKPTAFFIVYPEHGTTETRFIFDASGCTDPEDPAASLLVRWDWENDGIYDTEYRTLKLIQHSFSQPGNYTVVMEVIDSEGYGSTYSVDIRVTNPNTAPDADFSIDPPKGKVGEPVTFDASISSDLEDPVEKLEVRWDWDNDNIYDTGFSLEKSIKKTFLTAGSYIITVQVRDSGGMTDRRVKLVVIE